MKKITVHLLTGQDVIFTGDYDVEVNHDSDGAAEVLECTSSEDAEPDYFFNWKQIAFYEVVFVAGQEEEA